MHIYYAEAFLLVVVVVLISVASALVMCQAAKTEEGFEARNGNGSVNLVSYMIETNERKQQFASALLMYDPRVQKYNDPRKYDFHTCGNASAKWKAELKSAIGKVSDNAINAILNYRNMIVMFDGANLVGNIIFVPLEGSFPQQLNDDVVMRKYIKWNPPSTVISAVVPDGYRLRFDFDPLSVHDKPPARYIEHGVTPSFVLTQPVAKITVMKDVK